MNRLARLALLALGLLATVSCQDQGHATSPELSSTPVALRIQDAQNLPQPDIVAIKVWRDDSVLLLDQRYDWASGEADLRVPLHRSLRFELSGYRRRDNRNLLLWTASQTDTLDALSASVPLVTMSPLLADTTAPDILGAMASSGATLVVTDSSNGKAVLSLPAGSSSGSLLLPTTLADSLYVHGQAVPAVDGNWTVQLSRTDTATLVLVSRNGAVSTWQLAASTRDLKPISLFLGIDNGGSMSMRRDTVVFTLPYVVDSAVHFAVALKDAADRPDSIAFDGQDLSTSLGSWSLPVQVPVPDSGKGTLHRLVTKDSVGNIGTTIVLLERSNEAKAPIVSWATLPADKPWGTAVGSFVLLVVGGDSLKTPVFESVVFGSAVTAATKLRSNKDSVWWSGSVTLANKDSGEIVAKVENLVGRSWLSTPGFVHRYDPNGPDGIAPKFTVDPLPANGWTCNGSATLRGKAFDARSSKVTVLIKRANGRIDTVSWSASDSSWSAVIALAADVDTTVSLYAVDSAGNACTPEVVRIRRDRTKPGFDWPVGSGLVHDTVRTNQASVGLEIAAAAADLKRLWVVGLGKSDTVDFKPGTPGLWSATCAPAHGWSSWVVGARDSAGNDSVRVLRVLRDTVPPAVSWAISGSIGEGKYAVNASRDTLWLSSDTSVTLALSSKTGFAGVSVPLPDADSAGKLQSAISSLVLSQATETATAWTFRTTDELGNASLPVRLVVVGVAPVAPPVAKVGSSSLTLAAGAVLPWPKTVHYICPGAGALLQGVKADTLIHRSVTMSGTCVSGRLRSSLRTFAWSIADTASMGVAVAPVDSDKIALSSDASGNLWLATAVRAGTYTNPNLAFLNKHRLAPDSGTWTSQGSTSFAGPVRVLTARGADASGQRYFAVRDSSGGWSVSWGAAALSSGFNKLAVGNNIDASGIVVQGGAIHMELPSFAGVGRYGLASGAVLDSLRPSSPMRGLRHCATRSATSFLFYPMGVRPSYSMWSLSGTAGVAGYTFQGVSSGLEYASSPKSDSLFVIHSAGSIYKFASAAATAPSYSVSGLSGVTLSGGTVKATWEGDDLWLTTGGTTLYRVTNDLTSSKAIELPGSILGHPEADPTGGVWVLVSAASGLRVVHVRGSRQE